MKGMAKSEKPAIAGEPKSVAKKSVKPKAPLNAPPPRSKLPWAQVVSRATPAKPSERPPQRLKPPPLPRPIDEASIIEVSPEWLEDPVQGRRVSKRPSKPATQLRFVEAVRVLVGPNGEVEICSDPASIPSGHIEALLVATSPGLAERLLKR
jgi:hypothetical protein